MFETFIMSFLAFTAVYFIIGFVKICYSDYKINKDIEDSFTDEERKIILQMHEDGFLERRKIVIELLKEKNVFPMDKYNVIAHIYMLDCMFKSMIDGTCVDQRLSVKDLYERKYKDRR